MKNEVRQTFATGRVSIKRYKNNPDEKESSVQSVEKVEKNSVLQSTINFLVFK